MFTLKNVASKYLHENMWPPNIYMKTYGLQTFARVHVASKNLRDNMWHPNIYMKTYGFHAFTQKKKTYGLKTFI